MRLIDADDLIKYIPTEEHGAIVAVKCCPTTYDVNKVVEQLSFYDGIDFHTYIDIADIVRRGGIDEQD